MNPFARPVDPTLQGAYDRAMRMLLKGADDRTMAQLRAEMSKVPNADPKEVAIYAQQLRDFERQLNFGQRKSLQTIAPRLAKGIADHNYIETLNGIDDFNRVLLTQGRGIPDEFRIENKIKGMVVDDEGIMRGLTDAPRPIHLESKWDTEAGVRIRGSLNRMMVSKQILNNEYGKYCANKGDEACKKVASQMQAFDVAYSELSYIHGIADRINVARDSYFQFLMQPLEDVSNSFISYASSVMDGTISLAQSAYFIVEQSSDPSDKLSNVSTALAEVFAHFRDTSKKINEVLEHGINGQWDKYLSGSESLRSKFIGSASIKITILFQGVPAGGNPASDSVAISISNGAFRALRDAIEQSLDRAAVLGKIKAMQDSGAIDSLAAADVTAIAYVFPRTGNEILKNQKLLKAVDGMGHESMKSPVTALMQSAPADATLSAMVHRHGPPVIIFVKKYGFVAGANVAALEQFCLACLLNGKRLADLKILLVPPEISIAPLREPNILGLVFQINLGWYLKMRWMLL